MGANFFGGLLLFSKKEEDLRQQEGVGIFRLNYSAFSVALVARSIVEPRFSLEWRS